MTAAADWELPTDADLVIRALAGDQHAFAQIYDRYADGLFDFCVGLGCDRHTAADCVHDAFCVAASRLDSLREPQKLRAWLYSIVRNSVLGYVRKYRHEYMSDEMPEVESGEPGPDTLAFRSELIDLVTQAAAGLSERDRKVLALAYCHGLDASDIADVLGVSHSHAHIMVHRLRGSLKRSLSALLVALHAKDSDCPVLQSITADWNGEFTILVRKRLVRHLSSCTICDGERNRLTSPAALFGGVPILVCAPEPLRSRTLNDIDLVCFSSEAPNPSGDHHQAALQSPSQSTGPQHLSPRTPNTRGQKNSWRAWLPFTLLVAALIASIPGETGRRAVSYADNLAFAIHTAQIVQDPSVGKKSPITTTTEPTMPTLRSVTPPARVAPSAPPTPTTGASEAPSRGPSEPALRGRTPRPTLREPIIRAVPPRVAVPPPPPERKNKRSRSDGSSPMD